MANKPFEPLMKLTTLLLLILGFSACERRIELDKQPKSALTEDAKRRAFYLWADTMHIDNDTINQFKSFYTEYYPDNVEVLKNYNEIDAITYYAFNEELINPNKVDKSRTWMRCNIEWPFGYNDNVISLEKIGHTYYLNAKVVNTMDSFAITGKYKYLFPGEESTQVLDSSYASNFFNYIQSSGILTDTTNGKELYKGVHLLDGSYYGFEAMVGGKYINKNLYVATVNSHYGKDKSKGDIFKSIMRKCDELLDSTAIGKRRTKAIDDYYKAHPEEKR
jgi:hypothetical protein